MDDLGKYEFKQLNELLLDDNQLTEQGATCLASAIEAPTIAGRMPVLETVFETEHDLPIAFQAIQGALERAKERKARKDRKRAETRKRAKARKKADARRTS